MVGQSGRTYERYEGREMTKGDRDGRMFQTDSSDVIMYANPSIANFLSFPRTAFTVQQYKYRLRVERYDIICYLSAGVNWVLLYLPRMRGSVM
jgi:hypothetical protein